MDAQPERLPSQVLNEPTDQKKNIVVLKNRASGPFGAEQTVYICGTSHISKRSCDDVRELIQAVKPQIVMLELCQERRNMLNPVEIKEHYGASNHLRAWREGKQPLFAIVYSWMLSHLAEKCEVMPGEEFRVAVEEARKIGARISFGDRPVSITVARSWASLGSFWQKARFICGLLWAGLFTNGTEVLEIMDSLPEDEDALTEAMKDFAQHYPQILRPLLEERDEYMVWALRRLAAHAQTLVAVVGAGHLRGIQDKWSSTVDFDELMAMPAQNPARTKAQKWTRLILVTAAGSAAVASIVYVLRWRKLQ